MTKTSSITTDYVNAFKNVEGTLAGHDTTWLASLRGEALSRFEKMGLPTRRDEDWRYDNLKALSSTALTPCFETSACVAVDALGITGLKSLRILFVDGQCQTHADDLPKGLSITTFKEALTTDKTALQSLFESADSNALGDLSAAMMQDGVVIRVADNVEVRAPLQLIHHSTGANPAQHMGVYICLGKNSRLCLVDVHSGESAYWSNTLQRIDMSQGAKMRHFRLLDDGMDATHSAQRTVNLAEDATYTQHALYVGGNANRDCLRINILGERAHAQLHGAILGRDSQTTDILTRLSHDVANATSDQVFKCVLKDSAKSAYQGRVTVKEGAIGTEAHQSNSNLLLDPTAEANAKPELMIFTDDVKCSHGATVGQMDKEAYFYLVSRGIAPAEARAILVEAFIGDVIDGIDILEIRDHFITRTSSWMADAFGGNE